MAKKTHNEKLNNSGDLPKVELISPDNKMAKRFGHGYMLVAAPKEYDEIMKQVPEGYVITINEIRAYLAEKHNADFTCQLTAGIFTNLVAKASEEREILGSKDITPYWRTLKSGGELNPKYPGGIEHQKGLMELEGHEIINRGKRFFVKDFQKHLWQPQQ